MRALITLLGILALGAAQAQEQQAVRPAFPESIEGLTPVEIPKQYLVGIAPKEWVEQQRGEIDQQRELAERAQSERPKAVLGTTYSVIAPLFNGSDGNLTYIRFGNANPDPSLLTTTTTVAFVGANTGTLYGQTSYTLPFAASPQYSINEIRARCTTCGNIPEPYSLYLRNSAAYTGWQHVIYNSGNGFFENASVCRWRANQDYSALNQIVVNIHTNRIVGYPSVIFLHNYHNTTQSFIVGVFESQTGNYKGQVLVSAVANGSYTIDASYFPQQVNWTPGPTEFHYNLVFLPAVGNVFYGLAGQAIFNQQLQAYTNMTQICGIN